MLVIWTFFCFLERDSALICFHHHCAIGDYRIFISIFHTFTGQTLGEMSDVDKIMNPLHFGSDPAGIQVRIRINLENCIPIPDHFCLMLLLGALAEVCAVRSRRHLGQHSPRFCRTACLLRRSLQLRICIHDDRPISSQCHCQVAYADDTSMPIIRIAASRDHAAYRTVGSSK